MAEPRPITKCLTILSVGNIESSLDNCFGSSDYGVLTVVMLHFGVDTEMQDVGFLYLVTNIDQRSNHNAITFNKGTSISIKYVRPILARQDC